MRKDRESPFLLEEDALTRQQIEQLRHEVLADQTAQNYWAPVEIAAPGLPPTDQVSDVPGYPTDWRQRAQCLNSDPAVFHPVRGQNSKAAKKICQACVVKEPCLEEALADPSIGGVRGGMSETERRKERRLRTLGRVSNQDTP